MTARWSLMREVEGEGQKDFFLSLGGSSKNWDRLLKVEGQSGDLELLFWKLGRKFRGISAERNLHPPHRLSPQSFQKKFQSNTSNIC